MPTSLIIFLSIVFLVWILFVLSFAIKSTKEITKLKKQLNTPKKPTQLELYKKFGEEVLIDCGFPLENVYIKPAYDNNNGVIFNRSTSIEFTAKNLRNPYNYSNVFKSGETYMILPEIKDLESLCTWLHEIGHYMHDHLNDTRPSFTHEYEAEMYVNTIIKLCPIVPKEEYYSKHYELLIHEANLTYCINTGKEYVKEFIDKEKSAFRRNYFLSNDILEFINSKLAY